MLFLAASTLLLVSQAMAQIFVAGPTPSCAPEDVDAAIIFLPHERYCSLYYPCAPVLTTPYPAMSCPQGTLWDSKLNICNWPQSGSEGMCPQWECNANVKYPDVCCSSYWTCSAGLWTANTCPAGTVFDQNQGECASTLVTSCASDLNCLTSFVDNNVGGCTLTATSDVCIFTGSDQVNRRCAEGTQFNQAQCGCTDVSSACNRESLLPNKANDALCPSSFNIQFNNDGSVTAFSEKINKNFQSNSFMSNGVSASGGEGFFSANGRAAYLYAYYFANLQFIPPTAFSLEFRPESLVQNQVINLITNAFDVSANNQLDCVATISVNVTSNGATINQFGQQSNNDVVLMFDVSVTGSHNEVATTSFTITVPTSTTIQNLNSFSPVNFMTFALGITANTITAEVTELNSNTFNQNRVSSSASFFNQFNTVATEIEALGLSKCGLTVGKGLTGRMSQVNVFEGCNNGFAGIITG